MSMWTSCLQPGLSSTERCLSAWRDCLCPDFHPMLPAKKHDDIQLACSNSSHVVAFVAPSVVNEPARDQQGVPIQALSKRNRVVSQASGVALRASSSGAQEQDLESGSSRMQAGYVAATPQRQLQGMALNAANTPVLVVAQQGTATQVATEQGGQLTLMSGTQLPAMQQQLLRQGSVQRHQQQQYNQPVVIGASNIQQLGHHIVQQQQQQQTPQIALMLGSQQQAQLQMHNQQQQLYAQLLAKQPQVLQPQQQVTLVPQGQWQYAVTSDQVRQQEPQQQQHHQQQQGAVHAQPQVQVYAGQPVVYLGQQQDQHRAVLNAYVRQECTLGADVDMMSPQGSLVVQQQTPQQLHAPQVTYQQQQTPQEAVLQNLQQQIQQQQQAQQQQQTQQDTVVRNLQQQLQQQWNTPARTSAGGMRQQQAGDSQHIQVAQQQQHSQLQQQLAGAQLPNHALQDQHILQQVQLPTQAKTGMGQQSANSSHTNPQAGAANADASTSLQGQHTAAMQQGAQIAAAGTMLDGQQWPKLPELKLPQQRWGQPLATVAPPSPPVGARSPMATSARDRQRQQQQDGSSADSTGQDGAQWEASARVYQQQLQQQQPVQQHVQHQVQQQHHQQQIQQQQQPQYHQAQLPVFDGLSLQSPACSQGMVAMLQQLQQQQPVQALPLVVNLQQQQQQQPVQVLVNLQQQQQPVLVQQQAQQPGQVQLVHARVSAAGVSPAGAGMQQVVMVAADGAANAAAGQMLPPLPRQPGQHVPPWRISDEIGPAAALSTVAADKEIALGELQFGQQIGEGGFGKVYYGMWRGIAVAIKLLNAQAADSNKLMTEFLREVTTMTRVPGHPNVLKLVGVCTTPPNLALVTPYCSRGSLYGLLHSPGCYLSWVEVVEMLIGAARGMEHLHAHSILHRDLKSGNLLVDHDGCVKVADFGLSRLYQGMHTMTGGLGTFQWMAPEVLANQRYSNKADVYSFGMVMWECCARQVPFEGLNGVQAALAVMSKGMRPDIPPHTPPGLAALIHDCWAPVPEQRPGFDVVLVRLQELLQTLRQAEATAAAAAAANATAAQFNAQAAAQVAALNAALGIGS